MGNQENTSLVVTIDPDGLCPGVEHNGEIAVRRAEAEIVNARRRKADIEAEERSEDDGMMEHSGKSAGPAAWAVDRATRIRPHR